MLDVNACCAVTYGHPLARVLLGDSLHSGGLALTSRLKALMGIGATSNVLDVGSGLGASPVHLAQSKGCRMTAVTLECEGVVAGEDLASREGVGERVHFVEADIMKTDVGAGTFDSLMTECVSCRFSRITPPLRAASSGSLAPKGGWA